MAKKAKAYKTRRKNNEGSIFQRKDGRWVGVATIGYDDDGKQARKTVYGKTKSEVVSKLSQVINRIPYGDLPSYKEQTFGELMREWLLLFKKHLVSPRTFANQFRNFKLHIESRIGKMYLNEINVIVIQKILNEMLMKNYSLDVVRKVKFLISQFFEYAIENNLATDNPARKTKVRSHERKIYDSENRYKAIPIEVRDKFIQALNKDDLLKPFCLTMLFGGLRVGEALALRWENIDFKGKEISVEYGVTQLPIFDDEGKIIEKRTIVSNTKTACSVREVPMPDILQDALLEYKNKQKVKEKAYKLILTKTNSFVFGYDNGDLRTYASIDGMFRRFLNENNLDKYGIHFHGLRHTYSNMLFENNENPKVIQGLLGHKSVKTTITTYNSVDKTYFKKATDVFNKMYSNDKNEEQQIEEIIEQVDEEELEKILKILEKKREKNNIKETTKINKKNTKKKVVEMQ